MRTISRPILLALAGCGLSTLAAAPAAARTCPSGQFLQVSKGKCISKDSARKLGLASHGHGAAHAAVKPKPEQAGETSVAKSAPEPAPAEKAAEKTVEAAPAETTLASASPAVGASQSFGYAQAETPTVRRNIAPFGALQFGGLRRD
ncbi:MAG TPA: hypothetical protein PKA55_13835 [Rhodoblastus sp.]|nr:hypothetical protein [Rhodoblastus sp.]